MSGVLHRYERSAAAAVPRFYTIVSVFSNEGPPVPIPNTEVKLICADDTWREAAWENRSMLTRLPCRGGGFPSCLLCRTVLYSSLAQSAEQPLRLHTGKSLEETHKKGEHILCNPYIFLLSSVGRARGC